MKILVCEDDARIRHGIVEVLREEGYATCEAVDGIQALEVFENERPDFVCLDIMVPGRSGYDVCKELKNKSPDVPIMFITAKSEEVDRVLGLELGGDDYMVKPFGLKELVSRVRAITRRVTSRQASSGEDFVFGEFQVREKELRAYEGESVIDLSLRDVKILRLLAQQKNKVVGRDELFDTCWGMNYLPNSRTLDQHISKLRKKLGQKAEHQAPIETVHGVGYRYRDI